jgi:hypothetical protein
MAPVTGGRGNRFAHLEDVNNRQEPVREEPPATYQAQSKVQFASLREQIAALTKLLSIESGRDRSRHILMEIKAPLRRISFKYQLGRLREHEQRSSRMYSMDSFKSYGLKQIQGGPLSMIHSGNKESLP